MKASRLLLACLPLASTAFPAVTLRTETRELHGREREIVVMENDRVFVEIVPSDSGRIETYRDKTRETSAFEWLDDCPYHFGCRWEGKPFTYEILERGPDRASVTVRGGGLISVAQLRGAVGLDLADALDLTCERVMTLDADSTRLRVDIKITNTGGSVAPRLRYMMHGVWGQVPRQPFMFILPTDRGVEVFDSARATAVFREDRSHPKHPHNRFTPGQRADKPRFKPGGWVALLTSAGPTYVFYEPAQYDFFQYWYGGDAEWHWTAEPQSKAVDLAPGQTTECSFTLACHAEDVPFNTPTVAYGAPSMAEEATPGTVLTFRLPVTTARNTPEQVACRLVVTGPNKEEWVARDLQATVADFEAGTLETAIDVPEDAALGRYTWRALGADGRELGKGIVDVLTLEELSKRRTEKAIAEVREELDMKVTKLEEERKQRDRQLQLWRDGAELALSLRAPAEPRAGAVSATPASFRIIDNAVPVLGNWQRNEPPRIQSYRPAPLATVPANAEAMLAALGRDRAKLRDVAFFHDGSGLVALLADSAKRTAQVCVVEGTRVARRFGRFSEQPADNGADLSAESRAIAVDAAGNIWVATGVWGMTSVYVAGPTGQPSEETHPGMVGAVKVFAPDGRLLSCVRTLTPPLDLVPAKGDGEPVMLAPYRNVSAYHGAMVREGVMVIGVENRARMGELKVPAGSVAIDRGGYVWSADIAGHVARHNRFGKKLLSLPGTPAPAVPEARLPSGTPLPVRLRVAPDGSLWILNTLGRSLSHVTDPAAFAPAVAPAAKLPADLGSIVTVHPASDPPLVIGTNSP